MTDLDTTVPDNGAGSQPAEDVTIDQDSPANGGVTPDLETWKQENKVPYSRFEEVVRSNQEFKQTFGKQMSEVMELIKSSNQPKASNEGISIWNDKATQAKNWDEFVGWIQEDTFSKWEQRAQQRESEAKQALEKEIEMVKSSGLATNDSEVNAILKFAKEKSEEMKTPIPLSVAARWFKDTYKAPDNKGAAAKIVDPKKSSGGPGKTGGYSGMDRKRSLDEIVLDAKNNAPRG